MGQPAFEGFAGVWTPVAFAAEVSARRPHVVTVAGTPVVLYRRRDGQPQALLDRCPHRGASLALGRLVDDCVECPFHGWRFDGTGAVRHVPWNPDAKLERLRGSAVPVRELGGHVWIYTAVNATPDSEPEVHATLLAAKTRICGITLEWRTHWTRAMENMLDSPHLAFVHRNSIGRGLAPLSAGRMDIEREEHPWGVRSRIAVDGEARPGALDYRRPNQMNLHLNLFGREMLLGVTCVPVDAERTRLLVFTARQFLRSRAFDPLFNRANRRISEEDRAIVESSRGEVPPASEEESVRTDALTLAFRRDYFRLVERTATAPLRA